MEIIFIINGTGGCGKDTFCNMICEEVPLVENIDSVYLIKQAAKILGWDETKTEKNRLALSDLKKIAVKYFNSPFNHILKSVENASLQGSKVAFIHIREPKEITEVKKALSKQYTVKTILVKNDNIPPITTNDSDKNVLNYNYDIIVDNNGDLANLKNEAKRLIMEEIL